MSLIQWTDMTSNPIHLVKKDGSHGGHWCRKISAGCQKCYAETQNQSNYFSFASHLPYTGSVPNNLILDRGVLESWVKLKKPHKIFVCSMTDLFGEWVSDRWLDEVFAYMAIAKQHTFQILTKRPQRMLEYCAKPKTKMRINLLVHNLTWPLPKVWLGTTVENQSAANQRIPLLLETPAAMRFLSCEPMLEQIDIESYLYEDPEGKLSPGINWVIAGGESGNNARPCHIEWLRSLVHQCENAKVPVFIKQLGTNAFAQRARPSISHRDNINGVAECHYKLKLKSRKGGAIEEFPDDLKLRQFPL